MSDSGDFLNDVYQEPKELADLRHSYTQLYSAAQAATKALAEFVDFHEGGGFMNADQFQSRVIALVYNARQALVKMRPFEQEDFRDAVREDPDMAPERKVKWLSE